MKINDIVVEKAEDPRSEVKRREQFRTGGGTHKDRKKAAKRGEAKHKKQAVPMEGVSEENAVSEALPALPLVIAGARATPWLMRQGARILAGSGRGVAATPGAVAQVGRGVGAAGTGIGVGAAGLAVNDVVQMAKQGVESLGPLIESILGSEALQRILSFSSQYGLPILAMVAILYGGKEVIEYLRDKADRKNEHSADEFDIDKKQGVAEAGNIVDVEKDVSESTPVFNRYVKPFLDAAPEKIIEFYDKEAKNIIGRLTEERASLAEAKADTKLHDAVISKLQENFRTITESQALEVGDVEFVSPRQWRRRSDLPLQFPQAHRISTPEFENFEGIAKVESESGALLEFAFLFDIDGTEEASKTFTIYSGDLKLSKTQDPAELEGIASDLGLPVQAAANPATFESLLYRSIGGQEKIRSMIERYLEENYDDAAIELYQRESGRD